MSLVPGGVTLPCRNRTPAVLVLAVFAGLLSMHVLSGIALADATHRAMPPSVAGMHGAGGDVDHGVPAAPPPDGPHHGADASGHHPCLATPAAGVAVAAPTAKATPALPARLARTAAPARNQVERAPPDLNDLCVSRT